MVRLEGKVAIITGAAQGMGATHARRFVKEGAKVVLTDILEDKGIELAKELGENALFIKQDVTSADEWAEVVAKAEEALGPVNILVTNAGITLAKSILQIAEDEYRVL